MGFRTKLIIVGMLQLAIVCAVLFTLYTQEARQSVEQQYVEKARSIVLTTESMREEMASKWTSGVFSAEQLSGWAQVGKMDRIMQSVPVVTAWRAAMAKAKEGGYTFKATKFEPRNPKNQPDELEARVLRKLKDEKLAEYYEVDPTINAVRYFRPIHLTQECLLCHGDPATSVALWGNSNGLDPTGVRMENWKAGELHGAFEVIQSLDAADAAVAATLWDGAGVVAGLIALGALTLLLAINRIVVRNLIDPIKCIAGELTEGADQVHDAAGQVSDASQTLAEGASTQASSLEETAAALEEVASMTRSNASSAQEVDQLSNEARDAAQDGDKTMQELIRAMSAINESSDKISAIVKTIEEIAFQTNLLALNAAVEAARAGEHGKGFAVVADEVRSLAQRAATAAGEITGLIQDSVDRIKTGNHVASQVGEALGKIVEHVASVSDLISRISTGSREQSQGVDQVNASVGQLDRVTQQNASASEESAAAAQQLAAQSTSVKATVDRLVRIVGAG